MRGVFRVIIISFLLIIIISLAAAVFGFVSGDRGHIQMIFNANFATGAIVIFAALVYMIIPVNLLKSDKLADHSTVERVLERREFKRKKAYELLFIGIMVILIAGLVQLALAALL